MELKHIYTYHHRQRRIVHDYAEDNAKYTNEHGSSLGGMQKCHGDEDHDDYEDYFNQKSDEDLPLLTNTKSSSRTLITLKTI